MVKVTVEMDGEVRSFEGDVIVGQILTEEAGGIGAQVVVAGRADLETISYALVASIPDIFDEISADPLEAIAVMHKFEEVLNKKIKEYFAKHDEITEIMKTAEDKMKGGREHETV